MIQKPVFAAMEHIDVHGGKISANELHFFEGYPPDCERKPPASAMPSGEFRHGIGPNRDCFRVFVLRFELRFRGFPCDDCIRNSCTLSAETCNTVHIVR